MDFMQEVIQGSLPLWEACRRTPFLKEMENGTLDPDLFHGYMVQDSIYLKHYAKCLGMAVYHGETWKEIQVYYEMMGFVTDRESQVRRAYLAEYGVTDEDIEQMEPLPENQEYMDYLTLHAQSGDGLRILLSVLPCMFSYSYIFKKMEMAKTKTKNRYLPFIWDYAQEDYARECTRYCCFAEERCKRTGEERKEELYAVFREGSRLELQFWQMAYGTDAAGGGGRKGE